MEPVGPKRGAQKIAAMTMKRPASSTRTETSPQLGELKLHQCTHKSYICQVLEDKKQHLVVCVSEKQSADHQEMAAKLLEFATSHPATKEDMVMVRDTWVAEMKAGMEVQELESPDFA